MTTKKQQIIESALNEAGRLSREPLTTKQLDTLGKFIKQRLDTHGKYGYMLQISAYYSKQYIAADNIKMIVTYALNSNHIKIINFN